jgi:hypothetical protein
VGSKAYCKVEKAPIRLIAVNLYLREKETCNGRGKGMGDQLEKVDNLGLVSVESQTLHHPKHCRSSAN